MTVTAIPETPVGMSGKDPTGACGRRMMTISMRALTPEFRHMLVQKVDGDHPASYSDLILAVWKLERQNKARDPLLLKTTTTGGSNVTWSQTPMNLFPSHKLKHNWIFTAWFGYCGGQQSGRRHGYQA